MKSLSDWLDLPFYLIWIFFLKRSGSLHWFRGRRMAGTGGSVTQYEVIFCVPAGSKGHANVYVVEATAGETLIVTGQIANREEGVRAREYDYLLPLFFNQAWLISNGHLHSAFANIFHFTADMESGELMQTWGPPQEKSQCPFSQKFRRLSEIADRYMIKFPVYLQGSKTLQSGNGSLEIAAQGK
jgi:hypothetical protein